MPLMHCSSCHHEYEASNINENCDWCGSKGYVLEQKTALENTISRMFRPKFLAQHINHVKDSRKSAQFQAIHTDQ